MADLISKPKAFWSYERYVEGPTGRAFLSLKWNGESGAIETDGKRFEIRKQGAFSGQWILSDGGKELLRADKPSSWSDRFQVSGRDGNLEIQGLGFVRRNYEIRRGSQVVGRIEHGGWFSNKFFISYDEAGIEFVTVCFCLWLANVIWRRAAST